MKTRPIIFNAEMVRAILDGRKTQTRRCARVPGGSEASKAGVDFPCPYGVPGDRLWVRETWGSKEADHPLCKGGRRPMDGDSIVFRANPADDYQWGAGKPSQGGFCWRPSIHMPRWASRITLEVVDVRVERVGDISDKDAIAEGIRPSTQPGGAIANLLAFAQLWDSINSKKPGRDWVSNPWVWCISFRVVP